MDLNSFDTTKKSEEGVWIDIYGPDDVTLVAKFLVLGRDSKTMKRKQEENAKRRQAKRKFTSADEKRETQETLATMVVDWKGINPDTGKEEDLEIDGKKVEPTFDTKIAMIDRFPWIMEQVLAAALDRSYFLES